MTQPLPALPTRHLFDRVRVQRFCPKEMACRSVRQGLHHLFGAVLPLLLCRLGAITVHNQRDGTPVGQTGLCHLFSTAHRLRAPAACRCCSHPDNHLVLCSTHGLSSSMTALITSKARVLYLSPNMAAPITSNCGCYSILQVLFHPDTPAELLPTRSLDDDDEEDGDGGGGAAGCRKSVSDPRKVGELVGSSSEVRKLQKGSKG